MLQTLKTHQTKAGSKKERKTFVLVKLSDVESEPDTDSSTMEDIDEEPESLEVGMPGIGTMAQCPKAGCIYSADIRGNMLEHFANRHLGDTLLITEAEIVQQAALCGISRKNVQSDKH